MRHYDKKAIMAAFAIFARHADAGKPICQNQLGLNPRAAQLFVIAVTNGFTSEKHGFDLQKIFKPVQGLRFVYSRNNCPKNPKDWTLIDLVIKAMTITGKAPRKKTRKEVQKPAVESKPSKEQLYIRLAELNAELSRIHSEIAQIYKQL